MKMLQKRTILLWLAPFFMIGIGCQGIVKSTCGKEYHTVSPKGDTILHIHTTSSYSQKPQHRSYNQ